MWSCSPPPPPPTPVPWPPPTINPVPLADKLPPLLLLLLCPFIPPIDMFVLLPLLPPPLAGLTWPRAIAIGLGEESGDDVSDETCRATTIIFINRSAKTNLEAHLWNLNFLLDVHTVVGLGLRMRLRGIDAGPGGRQLRLGRIQQIDTRSVDLAADRLQGDLPLPQDLQFACPVTFVHRPELVATAAHSVCSYGWTRGGKEKGR